MSSIPEDLELLLSLQDRVLETPPDSPTSDRLPDEGGQVRVRIPDMSVFRDAVKDYLVEEPSIACAPRRKQSQNSNNVEVEKFSGLRIKNLLLSSEDIRHKFFDIRYIPLQAIRNLLMGDTISGCWATIGVLIEKGNPRVASTGKSFSIWKIGNLNESVVSLFLFGDACSKTSCETMGTVFAIFNSNVRKDAQRKDFSLNISSASQIIKVGISADYAVCKGKKKDGMPCTAVTNMRHGLYCKYHYSQASQKYSTLRTELKGGNLKTAFRGCLKSEGIYLVDPLSDLTNSRMPKPPPRVLSVDALKKVLSNADKVTTNRHSQGLKFLKEVTGRMEARDSVAGSGKCELQISSSHKRLSSSRAASDIENQQSEGKRIKPQFISDTQNIVELELVSTDEEL